VPIGDEACRRFRAMGSECEVRVWFDGSPSALLDEAQRLVEDLERRWSRFRPDSTLCGLNGRAGEVVHVDRETVALVALARDAWRATSGRFDPTVIGAMEAAGYRVSFEALRVPVARRAHPALGMHGVVVDEAAGTVVLPAGVRLDLGGIGKGRAADLVLERLRLLGAHGACVDLGGDVRVGGSPDAATGSWIVAVDDPFTPGADLVAVNLVDGAVTTSSRLRRRWSTGAGTAHHLIDPATGLPASSGLASVTVVSAEAAWGEAHAKAALVAGPLEGRRLLERAGLSALFVTDDREVAGVGAIDAFLVGREDVRLVGDGRGGSRR
jgi:thiamine biosynthesis lipoprotein